MFMIEQKDRYVAKRRSCSMEFIEEIYGPLVVQTPLLIMGALKIFAGILWGYVSRLLLRKLTLDISLKFGNTQIYLPIGS